MFIYSSHYSLISWHSGSCCSYRITSSCDQRYSNRRSASTTTTTTSRHYIKYLCRQFLFHLFVLPPLIRYTSELHMACNDSLRTASTRFSTTVYFLMPLKRPPVLLLNCSHVARCCACRPALYVPPRSPAARLGARHCHSAAAASRTSFAIITDTTS